MVGGQSVNLWVEFYRGVLPELLDDGPFTSKDIDFLHNSAAEDGLVADLGGKLILPDGADHTPNAALFVGELNGREVKIDFMRSVLGVNDAELRRQFVTIGGKDAQGRGISVLVMHPLHCFQSRLANIHTLGRRDAVALRQARATVQVLRVFIDELLSRGEFREAQDVLRNYFYTLKKSYFGKAAHTEIDLHAERVLMEFQADERLDLRWRNNQLARFVVDAEKLRARALHVDPAH
ncbi:hypothetical protein [Brevundimonas sanguinis]|uniref:hypothetical protein n=1 Tax=Brevundimonas sanguinis TaxID=3021811 RepID=UPI002414F5B7|nr:hypothetical protein [Brevundimonas sp. NCCP 15609]